MKSFVSLVLAPSAAFSTANISAQSVCEFTDAPQKEIDDRTYEPSGTYVTDRAEWVQRFDGPSARPVGGGGSPKAR